MSLGLLYWIARRRSGPGVACVIVLLAATSIEFYQLSHRAGADILVVFFVFLCFGLFSVTILQNGHSKLETLAYDVGFAAVLAVSFYAKNFFTFLVVLPPILLFLFCKRQSSRMFRSVALIGVFTTLALLPWGLALHREGGWEYLRVVFFDNTLGRFFNFADPGKFELRPLNDAFTAERGSSSFVYLGAFPWVPAPWSLASLGSLISLFRQRARDDFRFFLKLTIVVVPVVLTLSASKTPGYLVPLLFIMLLIVGELFRDLFSDRQNLTRLERELCRINIMIVVTTLIVVPIGLGVYFRQPALFGLTPLIALAFAYLARRLWGEWLRWRFVYATTCLATLAMLVTAAVIFPLLDAQRSYSPFFALVRDQLRDRELYTTLLDDRRLPLVEFYLDRRVPIIRDDEKLFRLLKSSAKVGVILHYGSYERLKGRFDVIAHQLIAASNEKRPLVLVNNR